MYIVTADASNSRRSNVSFPCHTEGILHRQARPLSLYPPMPYSQAYEHSVTDGLTNTMLFIGTPLMVICWGNFIHIWRSSQCHSWSRCHPISNILLKLATSLTEERETMGSATSPTMASPRSPTMDEIPITCHHQGGPNPEHSLCQTISNNMDRRL